MTLEDVYKRQIDPQIEMAMQSGSQQYLDLFNQMDDASIEQALATSVKNKDTVMEMCIRDRKSATARRP